MIRWTLRFRDYLFGPWRDRDGILTLPSRFNWSWVWRRGHTDGRDSQHRSEWETRKPDLPLLVAENDFERAVRLTTLARCGDRKIGVTLKSQARVRVGGQSHIVLAISDDQPCGSNVVDLYDACFSAERKVFCGLFFGEMEGSRHLRFSVSRLSSGTCGI